MLVQRIFGLSIPVVLGCKVLNRGGQLYPPKSDGRNSFRGCDACETDSTADSPIESWFLHVKSAVLHAISLAHYAIVNARGRTMGSIHPQVRHWAQNERLREVPMANYYFWRLDRHMKWSCSHCQRVCGVAFPHHPFVCAFSSFRQALKSDSRASSSTPRPMKTNSVIRSSSSPQGAPGCTAQRSPT